MAEKPNLVLILADILRVSDIGCYGSYIREPMLDRLAKFGLHLNKLNNSARCCSSRAPLLTGLHPYQAGIGWMTSTIRDSGAAYQEYFNEHCVTIAEVLNAAGYHTITSSKWHVGNRYDPQRCDVWTSGSPGWRIPTQRGFDPFYGTPVMYRRLAMSMLRVRGLPIVCRCYKDVNGPNANCPTVPVATPM